MRSVYAFAEIRLGLGSRSLPGVPGSRGPKCARPSCLESARDGIVLTSPDESLQGRLMFDARVKGRKRLPRRRGCLLLPVLLMVLPQRTHMSHELSSRAVENLKAKGPPAETRIANGRLADRQPPTAGPALSTCRRQVGTSVSARGRCASSRGKDNMIMASCGVRELNLCRSALSQLASRDAEGSTRRNVQSARAAITHFGLALHVAIAHFLSPHRIKY